MKEITFPYEARALRVSQPIGTFFAAVLPVRLLLQVAGSDRLRADARPDGSGYDLKGTQRMLQENRLKEIAEYINRADATFPNSVILAANYDYEASSGQGESDTQDTEDSKLWRVEEKNGFYELVIPSEEKMAMVIDGQHRLFSYAKANAEVIDRAELLCSVFLDLPMALQAQIFATINSNQRRVDKSLTYELFGYNIEEEDEKCWTPDKLAVFFARKLATAMDSPLCEHIKVAPKNEAMEEIVPSSEWHVSTAVVVEGISRLFSSNPKRDANAMNKKKGLTRKVLEQNPNNQLPLREFYIDGNDALIYELVLNYLKACNNVFWKAAHEQEGSVILKTIGVQALFDILRKLVGSALREKDISEAYFKSKLEAAADIDFSEDQFRNLSGSGRVKVRRTIEEAIGLS